MVGCCRSETLAYILTYNTFIVYILTRIICLTQVPDKHRDRRPRADRVGVVRSALHGGDPVQ